MRILWRTLPKLALPAALGLGIAYMGTGFVPRPAPNLRPPEELRALGQAYDEESPVRAILERNVLQLETPVFAPLGQMPAPVPAPEPKAAPAASPASAAPAAQSIAQPAAPPAAPGSPTIPAAPPQAAFVPVEPSLSAPHTPSVTEPLSGGPSVVGRIAPPASAASPVSSGQAAPAVATASGPQGAQGRQPAPQKTDAPKPDAIKPDAIKPDAIKPDAIKSDAPQAATAKAPAPAPAPSLAGIRLVGVIAGGDKPLAMLSVDGAALSLGVGGTVRGWTLIAVEPGQVVMKSGEHVRRLGLGAGGK